MKTKSEKCCKEFSYDKLRLAHTNYLDFYQSQWQIGDTINPLYVIYRIALALLFSITLIISIIDLNDIYKSAGLRAKWMIYLTNWHFSACTLQALISAFLVTSMFFNTRKHGTYKQLSYVNTTLCGIYWAFYTIAINGALFVSVVYWTMVYDENRDVVSVVSIFTHAMNAVLLLIDCFLIAHPIRLLHFYFPFCFNLVYIIFSIIYYFMGGTSKHNEPFIYSILDWNYPLYAVKNICYVFVFSIILHVLVYFYVILRQYIAKMLLNNTAIETRFTNFGQLMTPLDDEKEDSSLNEV